MAEIIRATQSDIKDLVPLLDQYRLFYKQASDEEAGSAFLKERFRNKECVVFLAFENKRAVGFTLLYTTFSSVSLQPVFILNDLFVLNDCRQKGIGEMLLNKAKNLCREMGYKGLALETATDNPAQQLYERLGWKKDAHCFHYFWAAD